MKRSRTLSVGVVLVAGLVLGLAAPAAAREGRSLINGSQIAPHSITGDRLKDDTVTGAQVNESTLGRVPNARKLGGLPSSAYQRATSGDCQGNTAIASVDPSGTVKCTPPLQAPISGSCSNGKSVTSIGGSSVGCGTSQIVPFYYVLSASGYESDIQVGDSGLILDLACHDPGSQIAFGTATDGATLNWTYSKGGTSSTVNASGAVLTTGAYDIVHFEGARLEGQFIYAAGAGSAERLATVSLHTYDGTSYCEYAGTIVVGETQ